MKVLKVKIIWYRLKAFVLLKSALPFGCVHTIFHRWHRLALDDLRDSEDLLIREELQKEGGDWIMDKPNKEAEDK